MGTRPCVGSTSQCSVLVHWLLSVCASLVSSHAMKICVTTGIDTHVTLNVQPDDTIRSVKEQIEAQKGISVHYQRMIFWNYANLKDDWTLRQYNIVDTDTVHMICYALAMGMQNCNCKRRRLVLELKEDFEGDGK